MPAPADEQQKQEYYRDARFTKSYDGIWQSVGKCVYCDLNPKYIFFEENGVVMTINLYAYIDGHMLIVPRRHVRSPKDLTGDEWDTVRKCFYLAKRLLKEVHDAKGIQLIQKDGADAQSTVTEHVHFQAIPFDAPDLCVWNYRKLKYTPFENAQLYRDARKKIIKYDQRFTEKYDHGFKIKVDCDLILINTLNEVLFEERSADFQVGDNWITMPGGRVDNFDTTLEHELAREVREETGLELDPSTFSLVTSRVEQFTRHRVSKPLRAKYPYTDRFIWNTYILRGFDASATMAPGDDAVKLLWIPLNGIPTHPRISAEAKAAIAKATA